MNPGTTLTFLALGKIRPWDALFYIVSQFIGGVLGVAASSIMLRRAIRHESVNYAVTAPGRAGAGSAWVGEFMAAMAMMLVVLWASNQCVLALWHSGCVAICEDLGPGRQFNGESLYSLFQSINKTLVDCPPMPSILCCLPSGSLRLDRFRRANLGS